MLRFLTDENFNGPLLRAVSHRDPTFDVVRAQDVGLRCVDDPSMLQWAADHDRVVLTHDVKTMTAFAIDRVRAGLLMPGVVEVQPLAAFSPVITDLLIVSSCDPAEINGMIWYVPLR